MTAPPEDTATFMDFDCEKVIQKDAGEKLEKVCRGLAAPLGLNNRKAYMSRRQRPFSLVKK